MKRISGIRKTKHKLVLKAVKDYYFNSVNHKVAQSIMGEKVELNEQEKSDVWAIKTNLEDLVYCQNLL